MQVALLVPPSPAQGDASRSIEDNLRHLLQCLRLQDANVTIFGDSCDVEHPTNPLQHFDTWLASISRPTIIVDTSVWVACPNAPQLLAQLHAASHTLHTSAAACTAGWYGMPDNDNPMVPWCCLLPNDVVHPTTVSPSTLHSFLTHLHASHKLHAVHIGAAVNLQALNGPLFADDLVHQVLATCADHHAGEEHDACGLHAIPPLPRSCVAHVTACAQRLRTIYHDAEAMGIPLQQQQHRRNNTVQFTQAWQQRRVVQHPAFTTTTASEIGSVAPGPSNVPDTWHGLAGTLAGGSSLPRGHHLSGRMCTSRPRSRVHGKLDWD